jgi:hypothetical protein
MSNHSEVKCTSGSSDPSTQSTQSTQSTSFDLVVAEPNQPTPSFLHSPLTLADAAVLEEMLQCLLDQHVREIKTQCGHDMYDLVREKSEIELRLQELKTQCSFDVYDLVREKAETERHYQAALDQRNHEISRLAHENAMLRAHLDTIYGRNPPQFHNAH